MRNTWTSVDAALRLRLREKAPAGYFAAFPLGAPWTGSRPSARSSRRGPTDSRPATRCGTRPGWRDYALVEAGRAGAGRHRDADAARRRRRGAAGLSRRARRQRTSPPTPASSTSPACARATSSGSRPPPGSVGQPRRADGEGPRPPRDRERRIGRRRWPTCWTSSASTPRSTTSRSASRSCFARPRPTASTSTSTTSAATTSRRRSERCGAAAASPCAARSRSTTRRARRPVPSNLFLAVAQRPHAARLPRQQPRRPDGRDDASVGAWLREGRIRYRQTIVDGLEHAPGGPRPAAARRHDRQDARADRRRPPARDQNTRTGLIVAPLAASATAVSMSSKS